MRSTSSKLGQLIPGVNVLPSFPRSRFVLQVSKKPESNTEVVTEKPPDSVAQDTVGTKDENIMIDNSMTLA